MSPIRTINASISKSSPKSVVRPQGNRKHRLIKRIIITNVFSVVVVILAYFWLFFSLRNLDSIWGLFKGKENYEIKDTIPPTAPYLQQIPEATQNDSIDVTGGSEQGVKVKLFVDDVETASTIADNNGAFTFTGVKVSDIKERIYVKAEDESNNQSAKSEEYMIFKDTTPPEAEIITPTEGQKVKSTSHSFVVTGKSEPDATVMVNGQLAIVTPAGEFTGQIRLENGKNEIKIEITDKAQNKFEKSIFVNFEEVNL